MKPLSLSASAVQTYEACPAKYNADYIVKARDMSGSAANLGTACHSALELFVANEDYKDIERRAFATLQAYYHDAYWNLFSTPDRFDEGVKMLENWWSRTDLLDGRKVLSTEVKETFELKTSAGPIPFNFIWDRCDELPDGEIEVIDYKSVARPIQPDDLKKMIQPRMYGLAAAIKYPDAKAWWVSFDLLRYDVVGVRFTREDNIATWRYLQGVAERILADDGTEERLNPTCRFCIRASVCEELVKHANAGGLLGITDPQDAIDRRASLDNVKGAIDKQLRELDDFLLEWAEGEGVIGAKTDRYQMDVAVTGRREIDPERASKIVGPDIMARYGKLNMGSVDALMKGNELDADQKRELKGLISKKMNAPRIQTKPLAVIGDDD